MRPEAASVFHFVLPRHDCMRKPWKVLNSREGGTRSRQWRGLCMAQGHNACLVVLCFDDAVCADVSVTVNGLTAANSDGMTKNTG